MRSEVTSIPSLPLAYVDQLRVRAADSIDLLVIHCTELPDLAMARDYGERIVYDSWTGNSGHYYIDRDGSCQCWVPAKRIAHHTRGFNSRSLGVELVNLGRYPAWLDSRKQVLTEPYPEVQIQALIELANTLCAALPGLKWIAGHEELDLEEVPASDDPEVRVRRKQDPGPLFPWPSVLTDTRLRQFRQQGG